jgi:hypothetical protein
LCSLAPNTSIKSLLFIAIAVAAFFAFAICTYLV